MKKFLFGLLAIMLSSNIANAADTITGVWKTIDDETGDAKSLVQIYEYDGKHFGRVIHLFNNPDIIAVGIEGDPKIVGLDIIWDMEDSGKRFTNGKILDPKKGKIYSCEIWIEGDNLIVRGKIGPFGRNQTWVKHDEAVKDVAFIPSIPKQK